MFGHLPFRDWLLSSGVVIVIFIIVVVINVAQFGMLMMVHQQRHWGVGIGFVVSSPFWGGKSN